MCLTFTSSTVVVTLLTSEAAHEESLGTLRVTLAGRQLPAPRARDALVPSRSRTRLAAQVTLGARSNIAVVPGIITKHIP